MNNWRHQDPNQNARIADIWTDINLERWNRGHAHFGDEFYADPVEHAIEEVSDLAYYILYAGRQRDSYRDIIYSIKELLDKTEPIPSDERLDEIERLINHNFIP